jgi:hypothetical protein
VTPAERPGRRSLTRADLPAELTAENLRHLGFRTLRQLAQPGNGVLSAEEQQQFDQALEDLKRDTAALVNSSLQRSRRGGPGNLDPELRRNYARTQQRLAEQARRARESFPELAEHLDDTGAPVTPTPTPTPMPEAPETEADTDVSLGTLQDEVEQSSETLDMLERIASIQQQQLDHQETQILSETRGLFFAFIVSVSVIIAGVAPLVEAEPHDRWLIVLWTLVVVALGGAVYAGVRAFQNRKE